MAYKTGAKADILNGPTSSPPAADRQPDLNEGLPWSDMTIEDLRAAWKEGYTLQELCDYLCQNWLEITAKCKELDLDLIKQPQRKTLAMLRKRRLETSEQS